MSRRSLATSAATRLGLLSAVEHLPSRPVLVVLAYHRILPIEESLYDPNVIETTPDQLDEQLTMLRRRYDVVGPEEMIDLVERPQTLRGVKIALTFDDGYIDNYERAFPILKSHGVTATFFVATDFVGTNRLPWWDRVGWMVRHSRYATFELTYPRHARFELDRRAPARTIRDVLRLFKVGDAGRFFADLARATGVEAPENAATPQFFSWEQARELEAAGMFIGSHSRSHPILSTLTPAEQLAECTTSRAILQAHGCRFADGIAYPVGERGSFTTATVEAARNAGYRIGFSNYGGANPAERLDRFNIKRFGLELDDDATRQLRARVAVASILAREPW